MKKAGWPLFAVSLLFATLIQAAPMRVVFINPADHDFWYDVEAFMRAAADDLGIALDVVHAADRFKAEKAARQVLQTGPKPDYLVSLFQVQAGIRILQMAEAAGVKSFVFNTDVPQKDAAKIGAPRGTFKHWIGHMVPNDRQAGADLADILIQNGRDRHLAAADGKLHLAALSGTHDSTAAIYRNQGLEQAVQNQMGVVLEQIVFAQWDTPKAMSITAGLLKRYPDTRLIWTASDGMGMGALQAAINAGHTPGKDFLVGGVDWTQDALSAVEQGTYTATIGGHFMDGGWALVLLYDYHHGIDFENELGAKILSPMQTIDQHNVAAYLNALGDRDWGRIDFTRFSKTHDSSLSRYDFSLDAVIAASVK